MYLKKNQTPIMVALVLAIIFYSWLFVSQSNSEFLIYIGVIIFFFGLVLYSNKKVNYSNGVLWGLMIWAILHMSGGGLYIGETRLYELILLPLSEQYSILKYDQLVHFVGFYVATLVMYQVIQPQLKKGHGWLGLSIVVVMAGAGLGALNEVIEFIATVVSPSTGVGGYENTALDLVFNLFGAVAAMTYVRLRSA